MRKIIGNRLAIGIMAAAMMMASTVPAFAQEWKRNDTGWWYEYDNGTYPTDSWQLINGVWYHFNQAGYMDTGWVLDKDGRWYFTNSDGAMLTGWTVVENKGYYLNPISNGYKGAMATGTVTIDGVQYTFDASGACTTGFPRPSKAYYRNGVEVTNQNTGGSRGGSSSDDSDSDKTILEKFNEEVNQNVEAAVKNEAYSNIIVQQGDSAEEAADKPIVSVSAVTGSETNKSMTVTLGSKEVQERTDISEVKEFTNELMNSIINLDAVTNVRYLGKDMTKKEGLDHLNKQFDNGRTLDKLSDEYTVTLTLLDEDGATYTVTYTVNVRK